VKIKKKMMKMPSFAKLLWMSRLRKIEKPEMLTEKPKIKKNWMMRQKKKLKERRKDSDGKKNANSEILMMLNRNVLLMKPQKLLDSRNWMKKSRKDNERKLNVLPKKKKSVDLKNKKSWLDNVLLRLKSQRMKLKKRLYVLKKKWNASK